METGYIAEDDLDKHILSGVDVRRALESGPASLLILEFDSMPSDVQTDVARLMKGVTETDEYDGAIGYACEQGDAVVRAEFDLSGRVRTWSID